jgi:lipopolysaccharide exporter
MTVGRPAERRAASPAAPSVRELVRQVKWLGAGEAVAQVASNGMILALAALLTPRAFGTVAVGIVLVNVANLLTQAGTGNALIAARSLTIRDVRVAVARTLAAAAAVTAVLVAAAEPITRTIAAGSDPAVIRVLALTVTLSALGIVPNSLLRKALDFRRVSTAGAVCSVVTAGAAVTAALLGAGVWALVVRWTLYEVLLVVLLWMALRGVLPRLLAAPGDDAPGQRRGDRWPFLVVSAAALVAMSMDNVVVGATLDARQLGFYALAFSIAFVPLTQISLKLGQLLFPAAAATRELAIVGRRTVTVVRVSALLLFPLVPAAVVLAPTVVPGVLGDKWQPAVAPLQFLLIAGTLHAVTSVIGESLSGTGNIRLRVWSDGLWAFLTVGGVALLTQLDGIRGAALAHLVSFVPIALVYVLIGARRIGTSPSALWVALRDVLAAVAVQAVMTAATATALGGARDARAAAVGAAAGLAAAIAFLAVSPSRPLDDLLRLAREARPHRSTVPASGT